MRLVIAEGSAILRAGLAHVLGGQGHHLAAAVHDARVLPDLVDTHRPDVLIANVRLAPDWGDEGLRAALDARRGHPGLGVLLFADAPDPRHVGRLFQDGGAGLGYLLQDRMTDAEELTDSLLRIAAGGAVVDPRMVAALAAGTAHRLGPAHPERAAGPDAGPDADGLDALSGRELEVLALMAQGRTNGAIAERLVISPGTVEKRVAAVFDKLRIPGGRRDNRRVLAVLHYLAARQVPSAAPGLRLLSTAA
ncbi:response regulator transcription factor [Streptacidiphilus carbonis]|jgi:DNA-binding NarL/FixJ family response regulator|uniref:response regulator transcription factor n=1 Tax=Streptacidiphilus carbonis TaxID=105422 RepID=UPI0005A835F5|nr:response regulator transcription factor [Streptacidiphilus carbonis]